MVMRSECFAVRAVAKSLSQLPECAVYAAELAAHLRILLFSA